MPVEFIGMIHTNDGSESRPQTTALLDPDFTRRHAQAHEDAGFDRVLIGYGSSWPEGTQVAAHVAGHTQRLGLLIAHRPGFVFPTLAARQFATLDQFSGGRVAVHVITGGNDAEQRRDGDYLGKDERYARTDEYLEILRRSWTQAEAFSLDGRFYRFEGYYPGCGRCGSRHPAVLRRLLRRRLPGRRQARGHVRAGGEPLRGRRAIASVRAAAPPRAARARDQRVIPAILEPGTSPGNGRTASWSHREPRSSATSFRAGAARTGSRRTPARSGCWRARPKATCTTGHCGQPQPGPAEWRQLHRLVGTPDRSPRRYSLCGPRRDHAAHSGYDPRGRHRLRPGADSAGPGRSSSPGRGPSGGGSGRKRSWPGSPEHRGQHDRDTPARHPVTRGPQLQPPTGPGRWWSTRSGTSTGSGPGGRARGQITRVRDPPAVTTSPEAWPWPGRPGPRTT